MRERDDAGGYQAGKDVARLESRMDSLERKVTIMGAQTQAALQELDSSIQEVAGEMDALAEKVEAGELDDAQLASALRERSTTLRGLRPSETVPDDTSDATPAEPVPGGVVVDDQGNPPTA